MAKQEVSGRNNLSAELLPGSWVHQPISNACSGAGNRTKDKAVIYQFFSVFYLAVLELKSTSS